MKKNLLLCRMILWVSAFFVVLGCSSKKVLSSSGNLVSKDGIIEVSANWIKDRGKKTDFEMVFANKTRDFLVIPFSDLECRRGKSKGKASTPLGTFTPYHFARPSQDTIQAYGTNEIGINPDEEKQLTISCAFAEKGGDGKFVLRIKNIYKRTADGKGALVNVAKDLIWRPNN